MFSHTSSVFWILLSFCSQRWVNLSHMSWDSLKNQSSCVWCAQSEIPVKSHLRSQAFHLWSQWVFHWLQYCMSLGLVKWRFLLHRFPCLLILHPAAVVFWLIEDHHGRTSTGISQIPNGPAELLGCHRRRKLYLRAAGAAGRHPGLLGSWLVSLRGHFSSQRSWTLEKWQKKCKFCLERRAE